MAKKFGKFLLLTAAVGTAAAAAYYYMQKKDSASDVPEDEDYDDFSEDPGEGAEASRNYVPLNTEAKADEATGEEPGEKTSADGQAEDAGEAVAQAPADEAAAKAPADGQAENTVETVEEFLGEEDSPAGGN